MWIIVVIVLFLIFAYFHDLLFHGSSYLNKDERLRRRRMDRAQIDRRNRRRQRRREQRSSR